MNTSKLDDQDSKLFNLAVWHEEPPEIFFSKNARMLDSPKRVETYVYPKMFNINFPGLGTLRLVIWTISIFSNIFKDVLIMFCPGSGLSKFAHLAI